MSTTTGAHVAGSIRTAVGSAVAQGTGSAVAGALLAVPAGHLGVFLHAALDAPDGGPLGPLAVQITFTPKATPAGTPSTLVRIVMTGFDEGVRWKRYLGLATTQWQRALGVLKMLLEK